MVDPRDLVRFAVAALLGGAGVAHFVAPEVFVEHLPPVVPAREAIVFATGLIELALAAALIAAPPAQRPRVGAVVALYLLAVFPGNLYVALTGTVYPAPWQGWARLPLQPLLIAAALWSTRTQRR